jgi:hypothetical protein
METRISKEYISQTMNKLKIGKIEQITEIPLRNDMKHKRVIIKLKWNQSENATNIKTRLQNKETIKIVYEWPWFWRVVSTHPQI